tara:strand:+ start:6354 stop:8522 length:2169 start_codon:yes stop_codon:yes gene_type:complete
MTDLELQKRKAHAKAAARMRLEQANGADPTVQERWAAALETTGERGKELFNNMKNTVLGTDRLDEPYLQEMPELFSANDPVIEEIVKHNPGTYNTIATGFYASSTPEQQIDILKENIPSMKFHTNKHGDVLVKYRGKVSFLNKPGLSTGDVKGLAIHMSSDVPAMFAVSKGVGMVDKAARASMGFASTSITRDIVAAEAGATEGINTERAAISAAFGAGGEAVVPFLNWMKTGKMAKGLGTTRREVGAAQEAVTEAKPLMQATGIDLFPAQQTLAPKMLAAQRSVLDTNVGISMSRKALEGQNKQVSSAVNDFIYQLATPEQAMKAPFRVQAAAQKSIDVAKLQRKEAASPIYTQALDSGAVGEVSGTISLVKGLKTDYKKGTKMYNALSKVQSLLQKTTTKKGKTYLDPQGVIVFGKDVTVRSPVTNPKHLHSVKLEIDAMLAQTGENAVDNTTRSLLAQAQKSLVNDMDNTIPSYGAARAEYAKQSETVSSLIESPLFSISNVKPQNIEQVTNTLFSTGANKASLLHSKRIIQKTDPKAWDSLVTHEMEKRLGNVRSEAVDAATTRNEAQLLLTALTGGKTSKDDLLRGAMGESQQKNYDVLIGALRRASVGRPAKTVAKLEDQRVNLPIRIYGKLFGNVRDMGRLSMDAKHVQHLTDTKIAAVTDALLNPKWEPRMLSIRKLGPTSEKGATMFQSLVNDIVQSETQLEAFSTYGTEEQQ